MKDITKYHGYRHLPRFILRKKVGSLTAHQGVRLVEIKGTDATIVAFCEETKRKVLASVHPQHLAINLYAR